ncbi:hypothetical protein [Asticcacaulis sp.]|uniref:hypothetical protein n=1 Tax=Asticcacaulis sp. TaxID=1872648 RepID=UPI002C8148AA|nr:hypothetical protein [Asticcacaulis sp.]HTM81662.1 hypothetical protein [Asticcacaulis sp.]
MSIASVPVRDVRFDRLFILAMHLPADFRRRRVFRVTSLIRHMGEKGAQQPPPNGDAERDTR